MTGEGERPTPSKTGRLIMAGVYGATAGMAVGFVFQAVSPVPPDRAVAVWRNFIVAGAVLGIVLKLLIGLVAGSKESARRP